MDVKMRPPETMACLRCKGTGVHERSTCPVCGGTKTVPYRPPEQVTRYPRDVVEKVGDRVAEVTDPRVAVEELGVQDAIPDAAVAPPEPHTAKSEAKSVQEVKTQPESQDKSAEAKPVSQPVPQKPIGADFVKSKGKK